MTDLKLEVGEGILLQTNDAGLYDGNNETEIDELYLTNKNLICVFEKSTGVFKSESVVHKIPLSTIAVVNGIVQVEQVDDIDYGKSLQIIYTNGRRELLELNVSPKKQYPAWKTAISDAVIRLTAPTPAPQPVPTPPPVAPQADPAPQEAKPEKVLAGTSLFAGIKGAVDAAKQTFSEVAQSATETFGGSPKTADTQTTNTNEGSVMEEKKYIFCSNCGEKLAAGSKFCNSCGTPTAATTPPPVAPKVEPAPVTPPPIVTPSPAQAPVTPPPIPDPTPAPKKERATVYDGEIHKCPNCGEVINSFVTNCPACGFELSRKQVSASLQKFIDRVDECDRKIASCPESKTGWASWNKTKRFWWVVLNLLFLCIPLVIYLVWPLVRINATPKLSVEEKQLASVIENFPFPNDRESILAALVYAKEKIDFISKEKIDRKSAYWMRLWCAKADQLKQKADMMFPNDPIVKESYNEIQADDARVKKTIKIKGIIGLVILAAVIIFAVVRYGVLDRVGVTGSNGGTDYSATFEWQNYGLFTQIPEPETNNGKIVLESEKQIQIELYKISKDEFNDYVTACKNAGFTAGITKTDSVFYANDDEGYKLSVFYYENKDTMNVYVSAYELGSDTGNSGASNTTENTENNNDATNTTTNTTDTTESTTNTTANNNPGTFDAETIAKQLKVTEHCRNEYGHYFPVLVIENPTQFHLSLSVDIKFYNKEGKLVGAKSDEVYAFEAGTKTLMQFSVDEEFERMEYEFTVEEEDYYNCVVSSLKIESVAAKDKEIVSVTNTGKYAAEFVEGFALFFKDGKLVAADWTYFTDDDNELKPGKTITEELTAWGEDYDKVEFYFTGRAEK